MVSAPWPMNRGAVRKAECQQVTGWHVGSVRIPKMVAGWHIQSLRMPKMVAGLHFRSLPIHFQVGCRQRQVEILNQKFWRSTPEDFTLGERHNKPAMFCGPHIAPRAKGVKQPKTCAFILPLCRFAQGSQVGDYVESPRA